mgnify:FL=1
MIIVLAVGAVGELVDVALIAVHAADDGKSRHLYVSIPQVGALGEDKWRHYA